MRKELTLDTNVLLRLILHDDEVYFERAVALINTPRCYFTILDQVILECVYILEKKDFGLTRPQIAEAITAIMLEPRLDYNEPLFNKVFKEYISHPKLSLTDCYISYKADELGRGMLYTFDEKFARQSKYTKLVP
ncbi:PIN domain-containing protein [Candidatus Saccharibacteria bacterium]|nr:PIN domain-containing protein [Candidatus Saccharibacteria bacterium]